MKVVLMLDADNITEDVQMILDDLRKAMVGNVYIWQPENRQNARAYARIRVVKVEYNGDEFLVYHERADRPNLEGAYNDLRHFLTMIAAEAPE